MKRKINLFKNTYFNYVIFEIHIYDDPQQIYPINYY